MTEPAAETLAPTPADPAPPTTRDWIRGSVVVLGILAAMLGGVLWLITTAVCECATRPPA